MNFYDILDEIDEGVAYNPFAGKRDGNWIEGGIDIDFLNNNFGSYDNATDMKANTESEGLRNYFDYLVNEGKLQQ